jgi:hypothetical protein
MTYNSKATTEQILEAWDEEEDVCFRCSTKTDQLIPAILVQKAYTPLPKRIALLCRSCQSECPVFQGVSAGIAWVKAGV